MSKLLRIPAGAIEDLRAHARRDAPHEACGVLAGRRVGDDIVVERVVPTRNASPAPAEEYEVEGAELLRVVLQIEDGWGLDVVGFYHSHPRGPPRPSLMDAARATWTGAAHLLVWLQPVEGVGCWMWDEESRAFRGVGVQVT